MKKQHKGIFFLVIFGGGLLFWATAASTPGLVPESSKVTATGTPADNYPDVERPQFCGTGQPKSTAYVQEFAIPTECTNPLGIVTDPDGNVWFTETNTGGLGKFDPVTETFTEYDNPAWPPMYPRSMMWGIDYAPDGSVWFTDEAHNSVWRFSTITERYDRLSYPSEGNSLPQKLLVHGSQIIINDFAGNKITFMEPSRSAANANYITLPSPIDNSVTADFAMDDYGNLWYTNWLFQQGGVLVRFDHARYLDNVAAGGDQFLPLTDYIELFGLPAELLTPNGIEIDGRYVWLADTSSSYFFRFDPITASFTQYVTAPPLPSTFGNQTGIVKTPISRPYWMEVDDAGRIVFNSQTSNNISVMDPRTESLVEYHVPSKNPYWSDCDPGTGMMMADCGVAQIFDITVDGSKIWFTEWVENNIGVVDTDVPLPAEIDLESASLVLERGDSENLNFMVLPRSLEDLTGVQLILSPTHDFIDVNLTGDSPFVFQLDDDAPRQISTEISASDNAIPGTYKVLVGLQTADVAISKFVTVTIV